MDWNVKCDYVRIEYALPRFNKVVLMAASHSWNCKKIIKPNGTKIFKIENGLDKISRIWKIHIIVL